MLRGKEGGRYETWVAAAPLVAAEVPRDGRAMNEGIDRARLRARERTDKRRLLGRNEGLGELRRLSEEELQERDDAVALQMEVLAPSMNYPIRIAGYRAELMRREVVLQRERMEELNANVERQIGRMEELNANLVRQREQMEELNKNLDRLLTGVAEFANIAGTVRGVFRRLRP